MNAYFRNTILFAILFTLCSCGLYKHEAEEFILFIESESLSPPANLCYQNSLAEDLKYIRSPEIISLLARKLNKHQPNKKHISPSKLEKSLGARRIGGTDAVKLRYTHKDEEFAQRVVDAWINILVTEYSENLDNHRKLWKNNLSSINQNLQSTEVVSKAAKELSKSNKHNKNILNSELPEDFSSKINYEDSTIRISYKHPDIGYSYLFASYLANTLLESNGYISASPKLNIKREIVDGDMMNLIISSPLKNNIRTVKNEKVSCSTPAKS